MAIIEILTSAGVKVAQLDERECSCSTRRVINGEWSVDLQYPIPTSDREDKSSLFTDQGKIRVVSTDGTATTFEITKPIKTRESNGTKVVSVSGEHYGIVALGRKLIKAQLGIKGVSPTVVLTKLLS